ncbi:MAG: M48 family metallopeptidase [Pseudohongiellaceae bacterium]|nr:M48 family metallopeptidase [Pseudohongiellaceae bacterium]
MFTNGQFQFPRAAQSIAARAHIETDHISVYSLEDDSLLIEAELSSVEQSIVIAGQAVSLQFEDNSLFTPSDTSFRWPHTSRGSIIASALEQNALSIILALVAVPLLVWLFIAKGIPVVAKLTVSILPDSVREQMDSQTLDALEFAFLQESELTSAEIDTIQALWLGLEKKVGSDTYPYTLHIRSSPTFGANAFALPNGSIILTDTLGKRLIEQPDALSAVLLHEIGHVEHQHGPQMVAQSLGAALVLSFILGDLEGISELILGSGSTLLDAAFSRDMEREADTFAAEKLLELGMSSTAFADAMVALAAEEQDGAKESTLSAVAQYLSSHPTIEERIQAAQDAATKQ